MQVLTLRRTRIWLEEGNIREKVQFLGMINQVETLMHNIDVVVLPSLKKLALSLIEGMASGCALIATDVGASSELVINEVNGFLINKGSVEELYNAMKYMIEYPKVDEMKKSRYLFQISSTLIECFRNINIFT